MPREASYSRFFHKEKSPHAVTSITGRTYKPKHAKKEGTLIWNPKKQGSFKGSVQKLIQSKTIKQNAK